MATRMLIDASHEEETRVVIVKGTRLEEFDYETVSKKQLKGNIYLAKVTRVEPSLQAAFVEYGGNRHGFLPFNEIHPDYYQLPIADREALLEQEAQEELEAEESENAQAEAEDAAAAEEESESAAADDAEDNGNGNGNGDDNGYGNGGRVEVIDRGDDDYVESIGGDDEIEVQRPAPPRRNYKIQEVIKRRQIMLVQVVKEERGNKGAALTTYISLPGRYSVLMPNSGRGGGISRKISAPADRKRLKKIAQELDVPKGIGVIIRTAGLSRTKLEIKRDYEFLMRLWDDIRELTLKSIAPFCVYEEANLIKRCIRDLYNKDISEILVEGEEGYKVAKDFMRKLMPSHAKKVQPYKDKIPLFHRFQVEQQFAAMYHPEVQLKSGGYIVINPTEALVSIDVNSGKATRERNVEDTAVKTNLEAAEEIARQLRLRDLAGLIVIDFIDMDDSRNNRAVERRMKECLKADRARIQVGRISPFGLMELSRQRLRPSFLESSTTVCHVCGGSGFVRSIESTALLIIRMMEEEGVRERSNKITVSVHTDVALYLLNQKRAVIQNLENLYGMTIVILADPTMNMNDYKMDREKGRPGELAPAAREIAPLPTLAYDAEDEEEEDSQSARAHDEDEEESGTPSRRRRRRRRKSRDDHSGAAASEEPKSVDADGENAGSDDSESETSHAQDGQEAQEPKRRRRGKRGGRRRSRSAAADDQRQSAEVTVEAEDTSAVTADADGDGETAVRIPITVIGSEGGEETETTASEDTAVAETGGAVVAESDEVDAAPVEPVKADDAGTPMAEAPAPEAASAESTTDSPVEAPAEVSEKKTRRRRTTKKAAAEDTAEAAAEPEPAPAPAAEASVPQVSDTAEESPAAPAETAEATESTAEGKTNGTASEPVQEEVVIDKPVSVTVIGEDKHEEVIVASKPTRRGWWRRS